MVLRAASITKGGSGPSGLDGDGWRRILNSHFFGTASSDFRKLVADFIKKLCSKRILKIDGWKLSLHVGLYL